MKAGELQTKESVNFARVAEAIEYLSENFKQQPDLKKVAQKIHLSPYHFQRLFSEWAGLSPKKFIQFLTIDYAKNLLKQHGTTLLDTAFESGLSGTGRLHDLFIKIEGMTPGEYKNGGADLSIRYSFSPSPFGNIIVASTSKGICHLTFAEDEHRAFWELQKQFPNARFKPGVDPSHQHALNVFTVDWSRMDEVKLHLKATEFQLKTWEALLNIPFGGLSTYNQIAQKINNSKASRAVGTAIGQNPIAFLIPCHRVIQSSGSFGKYHWGATRKSAMIGWEAAKIRTSR